MENERNKEYNIGLDIGTASVGWAVVDENFNIVKKGKKKRELWGVRKFEEASSAKERREYRSTRRRYDRRRERIKLLQEEFKEEIDKVDPNFFIKLKESYYQEDDKKNKSILLTKQEKKLLKEYQNKYPTIYHLRKELMEKQQHFDIRLIYLAIHHIIKYRGNFLYSGKFSGIEDIKIDKSLISIFDLIIQYAPEILSDEYQSIDTIPIKQMQSILENNNAKDAKQELNNLTKDIFSSLKISKEFTKACVGDTFSPVILLNYNTNIKIEMSFTSSMTEETRRKIENTFTNNKIEIINALNILCEKTSLYKLFPKGSKELSISSLMVNQYKIHQKDLLFLKGLFKDENGNVKEKYIKIYKEIFSTKKIQSGKKTAKVCLYDEYMKNKKTSRDFLKDIENKLKEAKILEKEKNLLDFISEKKEFNCFSKKNGSFTITSDEIKEHLLNDNFLPRISDPTNGKFPYQLNKIELEKIMNNASIYKDYRFLKQNQHITKLLEFRIPYYVGPLGKSKYSCLEKKSGYENVRITPYNFDDVVDKEKTADVFIDNKLGKCTYLNDKQPLPNNSILYSEFKVLNELKQLKVSEQRLTVDQIMQIMEEYFKNPNSVLTEIGFKNYLRTNSNFKMLDDPYITGFSSEKRFANNLNSYIDFFKNPNFFKDTDLTVDDAENIILWITKIEDKEILKKKILKNYPMLENVVNQIIEKNYSGWGNLSKELLTSICYKDEITDNYKSIMDCMRETSENFQQILFNKKYNFNSIIKKYNNDLQKSKNKLYKLEYSLIDELMTSKATKRGIWQTLLVVDEIIQYMGYRPKKIVIEMAKGKSADHERTVDRKKKIEDIYQKFKIDIIEQISNDDYLKLKKELKGLENLNKEKLFLYFIQEGRCLYTNEELKIEKLETYEVDHIIPQSVIPINSFDNKALVISRENQYKSNNLTLDRDIINKHKGWWKHLRDINLISSKKYENLTRVEPIKEEIEGFIERQLVETRQITKEVGNIIENRYKNIEVISLNANLSSFYREKFKLYKYRQLNSYHHAHDAYLACVLGMYVNKVLKNKMNMEGVNSLIDLYKKHNKLYQLRYGYIIGTMNNNFFSKDVLDIQQFNKTVKNTLYKNSAIISNKTFIRTGKFYKETRHKANSKMATIPFDDKKEINRYGGYTETYSSYMSLIEYKKRDKTIKKLIGIPIHYTTRHDSDQKIKEYIENTIGTRNFNVIREKIPFGISLLYENQNFIVTGANGKTCELVNNTEFKLTKNEQEEYKDLLNFIFNKKLPVFIEKENNIDRIKSQEELNKYYLNQFNIQINSLYDLIVSKIERDYSVYKKISKKETGQNLIEELKAKGKDFYELKFCINKHLKAKEKLVDKMDIITELFKITNSDKTTADLKALDLNDRVGRVRKNPSNGVLINKSVTGLKEKSYEF